MQVQVNHMQAQQLSVYSVLHTNFTTIVEPFHKQMALSFATTRRNGLIDKHSKTHIQFIIEELRTVELHTTPKYKPILQQVYIYIMTKRNIALAFELTPTMSAVMPPFRAK